MTKLQQPSRGKEPERNKEEGLSVEHCARKLLVSWSRLLDGESLPACHRHTGAERNGQKSLWVIRGKRDFKEKKKGRRIQI